MNLIKTSQRPSLLGVAVLSASLVVSLSLGEACNVGFFNLGVGNVGFFNLGYRNAGLGNVGQQNIGVLNILAVKTIGANNILTRERISFSNVGVNYGKK